MIGASFTVPIVGFLSAQTTWRPRNRPDDPKYILHLISQVIAVSLATQQIIATLPSLDFPT
jgi:hypothetical protein